MTFEPRPRRMRQGRVTSVPEHVEGGPARQRRRQGQPSPPPLRGRSKLPAFSGRQGCRVATWSPTMGEFPGPIAQSQELRFDPGSCRGEAFGEC